jgi:Uma2 family endonuclease
VQRVVDGVIACLYPMTLTVVRAIDTMPTMAAYETKTRRWTRIEYERLVDLGIFQPGEPVELIGGELMVAEPQGAAHYTATWKAAKALEAAFGPGWMVRTQGPIGLDDESEPEPDVAVVPGGPDDYRRAHPSRPVLTVEVAESSLSSDRERKGSVYARAGLVDYWIVNLVDSVLEVYRDPTADPSAPFGWRYARREVLDRSASVRPLAAPGASIRVEQLLS